MITTFRVFVVFVIVLLPHLWLFPFNSYFAPILLLVWLTLKLDKRNFGDLGLSLQLLSWRPVVIGCASAVLLVAFSQLLLFPLLNFITPLPETEVEMYTQLKGNVSFYVIMLLMGWLIGGIYEEIVFRGYIYNTLRGLLGQKIGVIVSFGLTSLLFGFYHYQLGWADALNAFLIGIAYHLLLLRFRGNLWYSIICHGCYNTMVITLLFLGWVN